MSRFFSFLLGVIFVTATVNTFAVAQSQSQPLGDYARAARKTKPVGKTSAKTYDNDNLPSSSSVSMVGSSPTAAAGKDGAPKSGEEQSTDALKKNENPGPVTPGQSSEDRQKIYGAWKEKVSEEKEKVNLLSRELDVLQRESQIRAAAFYADVGNRLRNSKDWDSQDGKYKQQIAEKQKALEGAKAALGDLEEQARKSGVPNSVTE